MKQKFLLSFSLVFLTLVGFIHSKGSSRPSSYPYISGDTFRKMCDVIIDETTVNKKIIPESIKNGDIIFLKADHKFAYHFFQNIHPHIKSNYILLVHNGDHSVTKKYIQQIEEEKLVAVFCQNPDLKDHPKIFPIPIGLANRHYKHGDPTIFGEIKSNLPVKRTDKLLYLNFVINNNKDKRKKVYDLFKNKSFCLNASRKPYKNYVREMAQFQFVLSPEGNGIDCHRTWEALLVGSIPIVKSSTLDSMFEDLPVVIIDDWKKVTEEFLLKTYEQVCNKIYNLEKLYVDYWMKKIKNLTLSLK